MNRRAFLKLGGVAGGVTAFGTAWRLGGRGAFAQSGAMPTVDRLVMTTVVDNFYDAFARGGKLETITVQRTLLPAGRPFLAEHGLEDRSGGRSCWTSATGCRPSPITTPC